MRIALIPAFEPDLKLVNTARELRETGFEVVIVNDGSGSSYCGVFEEAAAYGAVLSFRKNRGKGAVLKDGLQYIRQHYQPPYTVVTVDADGQHKTTDAVRCCVEAERQPEALILGSRRDDAGQVQVPLRSRLGLHHEGHHRNLRDDEPVDSCLRPGISPVFHLSGRHGSDEKKGVLRKQECVLRKQKRAVRKSARIHSGNHGNHGNHGKRTRKTIRCASSSET